MTDSIPESPVVPFDAFGPGEPKEALADSFEQVSSGEAPRKELEELTTFPSPAGVGDDVIPSSPEEETSNHGSNLQDVSSHQSFPTEAPPFSGVSVLPPLLSADGETPTPTPFPLPPVNDTPESPEDPIRTDDDPSSKLNVREKFLEARKSSMHAMKIALDESQPTIEAATPDDLENIASEKVPFLLWVGKAGVILASAITGFLIFTNCSDLLFPAGTTVGWRCRVHPGWLSTASAATVLSLCFLLMMLPSYTGGMLIAANELPEHAHLTYILGAPLVQNLLLGVCLAANGFGLALPCGVTLLAAHVGWHVVHPPAAPLLDFFTPLEIIIKIIRLCDDSTDYAVVLALEKSRPIVGMYLAFVLASGLLATVMERYALIPTVSDANRPYFIVLTDMGALTLDVVLLAIATFFMSTATAFYIPLAIVSWIFKLCRLLTHLHGVWLRREEWPGYARKTFADAGKLVSTKGSSAGSMCRRCCSNVAERRPRRKVRVASSRASEHGPCDADGPLPSEEEEEEEDTMELHSPPHAVVVTEDSDVEGPSSASTEDVPPSPPSSGPRAPSPERQPPALLEEDPSEETTSRAPSPTPSPSVPSPPPVVPPFNLVKLTPSGPPTMHVQVQFSPPTSPNVSPRDSKKDK